MGACGCHLSGKHSQGVPSGLLAGGTSCRNGQDMGQCLGCIDVAFSNTWVPSLALPHCQLQSIQTRIAPSQPLSAADVHGVAERKVSENFGPDPPAKPGEGKAASLHSCRALALLSAPASVFPTCPSAVLSLLTSRHSTSTTQRAACPQVIHFYKRRRKWFCCFHIDSHISWWRDVRNL